MGPARTALFLALLVSLALLTVVTFEVLERVQAEPSAEGVVAQQEGIRVVAEIRGSPNLADIDGDGVPDDSDNCPAWPNPLQSLPPWSVPPDDPDCDGFTTDAENSIGTNPNLACGTDAWPPDFDDGQTVNILDVGGLRLVFSTTVPPTSPRFDLAPDGVINILDVGALRPFFNLSCTP